MTATLYERLGYRAGIHHFAKALYERVLEDPVIQRFFISTDMVELADHMASYLVSVAGGPDEYQGKPIREAHAHLRIGKPEVEALLSNVRQTAEDLQVEPEATVELVALIESAAQEILGPEA